MDNITIITAKYYDHYRIGVVSVYGDDWHFCLTEDGQLLLSKTVAGEYGSAESMWLSTEVETEIYNAIKMDMVEEDYLNPRY